MNLSRKPSRYTIPWFGLGIAVIFLGSIALRFWGLSRFNTLVFDEVYFAKFANNYLTQTPFFDGHPPLSKYLIAIGIWLGSHMPWVADVPQNTLTGSLRSTFSYRWFNALTGSFIPLVIMGIAYQLTRRHSYTLIAGLFAAADGLFLVESRYALTNVYLVIFGLLGQWLFLLALSTPQFKWRSLRLVLAGICFGASASVKWNGLWFLLGIYLFWSSAWIIRFVQQRFRTAATNLHPLSRLTQLHPFSMALFLGLTPLLTYALIWIPHLQLDSTYGLLEVQQQLLSYHQRVGGNDPSVHPYCSPWYTWFWMIRPVVYFYEGAQSPTDLVPIRPAIPASDVKIVFDVHAMGNPALWWLSTIAIIVLLGMLVQRLVETMAPVASEETPSELTPTDLRAEDNFGRAAPPAELWVMLYLVVNYAANLLPWVRVTRCTFLYHYMGASVFAALALAWLVDRWLHSYQQWQRILGITVIFLILLSFVFWLPLYLGLPLSPQEFQVRRWLSTW